MSRWGIVTEREEAKQHVYFPHWSAGKCPRYGDKVSAIRRFRQEYRSITDTRKQRAIWKMCAEDFLFYLSTFVWVFRAKGENPGAEPFMPFDFQVEAATVVWKCMHDGQEDLRICKPRQVGITSLMAAMFEHAWHFRPNTQLLLGSRKKEELDGRSVSTNELGGEWSKLLPRLDFIHLHLPRWMLPNGYAPRGAPYRTLMRMRNPANGSLIAAESTNERFGRGGVYYAIGFDEHAHTDMGSEIIASSSQSSRCHIWWSSPNGPATAFAMLGRSGIRNIRLEWWMHPEYAEEMIWDSSAGDRSRSSPWLEKELQRIGYDPMIANNEIWADEAAVSGCFYEPELFDLLNGVGGRESLVRPAFLVGELDFRMDDRQGPRPLRWLTHPGGKWQLWCHLDAEGNPPKDERYILGADVATGSRDTAGRGSSNSTIAVIGEYSRSKVAEFATHGMAPHRFAEVLVAAARWFCGTERHGYMIWDARGPGAVLGNVIVDEWDVRDNVYWNPASRGTARPGYQRSGTAEASRQPWGAHVKMLWDGDYIERSADCVAEMRYFNHNPNGGAPIHAASKDLKDPSGARENHGDRMTATILACVELARRKTEGAPRLSHQFPPRGSVLDMRRRWKARDLASKRI